MLSPEDFRQQLEEKVAAKRQADQTATVAEKLRQQQEERVEFWKRAKQLTWAQIVKQLKEDFKELKREKENENQEVLELDSRLPIRQYLEVLRDKIAPWQQVKRYGPEEGKIAYGLVYKTKLRSVWLEDHTEEYMVEVTSLSPKVGYETTSKEKRYRRVSNKGLRKVRDVFGVVFNNSGFLKFAEQQCAKAPDFEKSTSPLKWKRLQGPINSYTNSGIDVLGSSGMRDFAGALTNFYVHLLETSRSK